MGKFAFIFHPHDIESLGDWVLEEPHLKQKRRRFAERALRWLPPFKRETVTGIKSLTGKEITGDMILWPMIPEQIINMRSEFTVAKLIEAGKLAQQLGAKIVGLGAYAAWIGKRGVVFAEAIGIPVTTGTSYTIAVTLEAIINSAAVVGFDLSMSTVVVIGATGSIGKVCAKLLAREVGRLILVARHKEKLSKLTQAINSAHSTHVTYTTDISKAVGEADIVLISTSTPSALVRLSDINPGTIVCDISLPHNILKSEAEKRPDVLVIDGGVVKPPGNTDFNFYFGLEKGLAYACMAETMILALEEMYVSYSLGGDVSFLKVIKMAQLAKKHGFKLAEFMSFGKPVPRERLEYVKGVKLSSKPTDYLRCPIIPSHLS